MASLIKRNKTYYAVWREGGRQRWKGISTDKRLAIEFLKDLEAKRVHGEMGFKEIPEIRFDDFAYKYLEEHGPHKAESTRGRDQIIVDKHLIPFLGQKLLSEITLNNINLYIKHRDKVKQRNGKSIAKSTINRELNMVKSLFARAVEWGYLKENPCKGVKKLKTEVSEPVFLSPEEASRLMNAATGQMRGFIVTGLNTGMRKGELYALKWEDIDFKKCEVRVRRSKVKSFRVIPMNDLLAATLAQHPRHLTSQFVFHNSDGSPWKNVRNGFDAILHRAGVRPITLHGMRHTFISNLVELGVDLRKVMELAGHKDISTTMRYAHLRPNALKDSVERLNWGWRNNLANNLLTKPDTTASNG
jgi:integrase